MIDLPDIDSDGDGVLDDADVCPGTLIPETVPTVELGVNRFALVDDDSRFDTTVPPGQRRPGRSFSSQVFTVADTAGCSCEQIIDARGLGSGHEKFGCSLGAMSDWIERVSP